MADALSLQLLRQREGLIRTARWDVNAYRVGYGSDTWTDANGNVHPVTASTVITNADAERDLERRADITQQSIISSTGQSAWDGLTDGEKAAVTSLTYNYGSLDGLPSMVAAIQSGSPDAVSQAILARAVDNGGINADRREVEADVAAGHPIPPVDIPPLANSSGSPDDRAPTPMDEPAALAAAAGTGAGPAPEVRTASGKMVEVGSYPSQDGSYVLNVTDDGKGNAVVTKVLPFGTVPGVFNPLKGGDTIAGGAVDAALAQVGAKVGTAATGAIQSLPGIAQSAGSTLAGFGSALGGLFKGVPSPIPIGAPQSSLEQLQALQDKREWTDPATLPAPDLPVAPIMPANDNPAGGLDFQPSLSGDAVGNFYRQVTGEPAPEPSDTVDPVTGQVSGPVEATKVDRQRLDLSASPANAQTLVHGVYQGMGFGWAPPVDGLVVQNVGDQNGRPVMQVSGAPSLSRPPAPTAADIPMVVPRVTAAMLDPASMALSVQPFAFTPPTTLSAALAGTQYADVASIFDQHFAAPGNQTDAEAQAHDAQEIVRAAQMTSEGTVRPTGTTRAVTQGVQPAGTTQLPHDVTPNIGGAGGYESIGSGAGSFNAFSNAMKVPLDAPSPLVAPVSRATPPLQTQRTITETSVNPAYTAWEAQYGSGGANASGSPDDRDAAHAAAAAGTITASGTTQGGSSSSASGSLSGPVAPIVPPAPPPTITSTRTISVGGGGVAESAGGGNYVIQPGDNLSTIAARNGTTVAALQRANGITDPNAIYAGRSLTIPGQSNPVVSNPSTKTSGSSPPASSTSSSSSQPIYVNSQGQRLTPQTIQTYNSDTQQWDSRTIYQAA